MEDEKSFEVQEIVNEKLDNITKEVFYFVRWKGYGEDENTWERRDDLLGDGHSTAVESFEAVKRLPGKTKRKTPSRSRSRTPTPQPPLHTPSTTPICPPIPFNLDVPESSLNSPKPSASTNHDVLQDGEGLLFSSGLALFMAVFCLAGYFMDETFLLYEVLWRVLALRFIVSHHSISIGAIISGLLAAVAAAQTDSFSLVVLLVAFVGLAQSGDNFIEKPSLQTLSGMVGMSLSILTCFDEWVFWKIMSLVFLGGSHWF